MGLALWPFHSVAAFRIPLQWQLQAYAETGNRDIMYYRITALYFDAVRRDEFIAQADNVRDEMKGISCIQSVTIVETAEGEAIGMATYDTQENADAATPQVQQILGGLSTFFTAPPMQKTSPVMWSM